MVEGVGRALAGVGGALIVILTLRNAVETFVLPRAAPSRLIALVFHSVARLLHLRVSRLADDVERDRVMAWHAPIALLTVPIAWVVLLIVGYALLFVAAGTDGLSDAVVSAGSSLTTLGFFPLETLAQRLLAISAGTLGLGIVALVISYLPSMYGAFQRRETQVALLETRAGSPPSAVTFLQRIHRIGWLGSTGELWGTWETWFADVQESHTSLSPLVFFRSPRPGSSWVVSAGAVMDAAAFHAAVLDVPHDPRADLCIRSGYLCLRHVADFFGIPHDPDPAPDDPISVSRAEFDAACDELVEAGVPLRPDRDQAWRDWAGWRVNYDTVLLALAGLTLAPRARWSGDRAIAPTWRLRHLWRRGAFRRS